MQCYPGHPRAAGQRVTPCSNTGYCYVTSRSDQQTHERTAATPTDLVTAQLSDGSVRFAVAVHLSPIPPSSVQHNSNREHRQVWCQAYNCEYFANCITLLIFCASKAQRLHHRVRHAVCKTSMCFSNRGISRTTNRTLVLRKRFLVSTRVGTRPQDDTSFSP